MSDHKQVMLKIERPMVDEEIEDIIRCCYQWDFSTVLSCQCDVNGKTWIEFGFFNDVKMMMQIILNHRNKVNANEYVRETLFDFIQEAVTFKIKFDEDGHVKNDEFFGNGEIDYSISMRFDYADLDHFKKLFFEVFPLKG